MSAVDTSREEVDWLAQGISLHGNLWIDAGPQASDTPHGPVIAATLRALVSERDDAKQMAAIHEGAANALLGRIEAVQAERDAARGEVARLREALTKIAAPMSASVIASPWQEVSDLRRLASAALAEPTP
jgi:hypothetical protein